MLVHAVTSSLKAVYPPFQVDGVPEDQVWQLFNVSNYKYYLLKVDQLKNGICPFCTIYEAVNVPLPVTNPCWHVWENTVAARNGQEHQFVIPLKRHVRTYAELTTMESTQFTELIRDLDVHYHLDGGVLVTRSGNPLRNAKSMDHLHVNYHVPSGAEKVQITVAKSASDLNAKLPVLCAFERMRQLQTQHYDMDDVVALLQQTGQWDLVKDRLK